jgi:xanthine dehydrogenase accessory factor
MCGGTASVLIDLVLPTKENAEFFRKYDDLVRRGRDFYLLTVCRNENRSVSVLGHSLLQNDGSLSGTYSWPDDELEMMKSELHSVSSTSVLAVGDAQVVVDPIRKTKTLYCFGAGHVGIPTVRIAALAGFRAVVVDDRAEFANAERFPDAADIVVPKSFDGAIEDLPIDTDSFIVIITRGHKFDRVVLEQALRTDASYIGMIGSLRKRDAIYSALLETGVSPADIERVHSPIGLAIQAETPEEIAVSIVSEMIAERAKQKS